MAQKKKSKKQVRYLLSKASPLNPRQKAKLLKEMRQRKVRVTKK